MPRTKQPLTRRIAVTIKWLERYGIQRRDTAIVAMTGDVRTGELGYFDMYHSTGNYNDFAFIVEQDSTCFDGYYFGKREPDSLCLRKDVEKCYGRHHANPHGRVIRVERRREVIEVPLAFRALDEREVRHA